LPYSQAGLFQPTFIGKLAGVEVQQKVLVIDDDKGQRHLLRTVLEKEGYEIAEAEDSRTGMEQLQSFQPDIVLLDVRLGTEDGMALLPWIKEVNPSVKTVLMTAFADVRDAVRAGRSGASDYLPKPLDLAGLRAVVNRLLSESTPMVKEGHGLHGLTAETRRQLRGMVVQSPSTVQLVSELNLVGPTEATVLLCGESGTGKEEFAQLIHRLSTRANMPLVSINCAALPESIVESELFGHVKGAFTGAISDRIGCIEQANGGTLFLDEIGELPLSVQPKLLRVLERGEFQRVGDGRIHKSQFRLIAATHRNLPEMIQQQKFRDDLFYRVAVFEATIPPLRDRTEEIDLLVTHFLEKLGHPELTLSLEAKRMLQSYNWPGNVRELRNAVERAAILAKSSGEILKTHLPPSIQNMQRRDWETQGTSTQLPPSVVDQTLDDMERDAIRLALEAENGNRTRAAERLGISRRALLYKLRRYREEGAVWAR
jgi:DNA-binding NtrC family response regulator